MLRAKKVTVTYIVSGCPSSFNRNDMKTEDYNDVDVAVNGNWLFLKKNGVQVANWHFIEILSFTVVPSH